MTQYLKEKQEGCLNLALADVKKITPKMIRNEAENQGISYHVMKRAWENYMKFGNPELRYKSKGVFTPLKQAQQISVWQLKNRPNFPVKELTTEEAGKLLKSYIFSGKQAFEVLKKNKISKNQFYDLIKELNVSGTVLGRKVLDPKQYAKVDVKQVIKFHKKPHLFHNMSLLEIGIFQRILAVLQNYL